MNIGRGYYYPEYSDYDSSVCKCFPRPSSHTIPSMLYDGITCPHQLAAHIQQAQETTFNYLWTANSDSRRLARGDDEELSERYSLMSEDDDQLRFSPNPFHSQKQPDFLSIQTAPPYVRQRHFEDVRDNNPPYTAPVNDTRILDNGRRVQSIQDIRDQAYRSDGIPRSRQNVSPTSSRISNGQFTGSYMDQICEKVYNYNVNYDGTSRAPGAPSISNGQQKPKPTTGRKPMTAP